MAKVRIQTRKKDAEEEGEDGTLPQPANGSARRQQNEGAIEILGRVLRTEGFLGWYKVCWPNFLARVRLAKLPGMLEGYGGPDPEGGALSGSSVHVEGAV
jgi:hypothetical protein